MGTGSPFVAVDWGTTRMRAMLCLPQQVDFASVPVIEGPGIAGNGVSPADSLLSAISPWVTEFGEMKLLLGGMVGSNIGWREVPYLPCPLSPRDVANNLMRFTERGHPVEIVPGLACTNSLGQPDVMRGEEVQVLGWAELAGDSAVRERLLCLPGTHTKWVCLENGAITRFTTSMTGELYAILCEHSVLVPRRSNSEPATFDAQAFEQGVRLAFEHGKDLMHVLFSARSRFLVARDTFGDARSFLSGLLIGADVGSALRHYTAGKIDIELVGDPTLCERFAIAIRLFGGVSRVTDGGEAAYAGFRSIAARTNDDR